MIGDFGFGLVIDMRDLSLFFYLGCHYFNN